MGPKKEDSPGMIGPPPSARGGRPADPGRHAQQIAREWTDVGSSYYEREGGRNTTGVVVDSGVLNPELLKGHKGGRIWPKMRLKDRIDAIISHEYEELLAGGNHAKAIRNAPKMKLPISEEARRLNRARAR